MKITQIHLYNLNDAEQQLAGLSALSPDLILAFGAPTFFASSQLADQLKQHAPNAALAGCSTAGEILGSGVYDNSCVITAINFNNTQTHAVTTELRDMADSFAAGVRLGANLAADNLSGVLIFGTGVDINGSALVAGLESSLPQGVGISGGLAADAGAFKRTWTLGPAGSSDKHIVAVGLYGSRIHLSYGSFGGWEPFGPMRKVTRCDGNILYELDNTRALDIYKRYLGDYAKDLPSSGLLFPFAMFNSTHEKHGIFRTILGINETEGSLTLAGDIDPNGYLALMHSSTDQLINGAQTAAQTAYGQHQGIKEGDSLALLVSCVGRKLVMGDRTDEEVEVVAATLGKNTPIAGYYSNGEIAGSEFHLKCHLHNQTMTITWIHEA